MDEEFLKFVETFREEETPKIEKLLKKYRYKNIVRFASREDVEIYMEKKQYG